MPTPSRLLGLCLLSLVACAPAQRTDTSLRVRLHTAAYVEASPPTPAPTDTRCVDASGAPLAATHLVGARGRFCTLHAGGTVCCWGEVLPPEPGDTDDHDGWRYPHRVGSLPPGVTQVALGARHACARVRDGRVLCWGEATGHRLGSEGHGARESAVVVPGLAPAEDLLVTDDQSCVRTSDGSVRCWGGLLGGQPLDAPRQVSGLPTLTRFVQGPIPCGLDAGGTLVCWHNNGHIEVGPRTDDPVVRFTRLAPAATMALAVDAYDPHLARGCSVGPTGAVRCFGPAARDCEPGGCDRPVEGLRDVVSIAASGGLTCAAQRDGSAWCWGNNTDGGVGDGTTIPRPLPTRVEGLTGVTEVAVTAGTACALHADGTVRCWGRGARGALGNGVLRPQHTPRRVRFDGTPEPAEPEARGPLRDPCVDPREPAPRQPTIVGMASGEGHNCVVISDGTLRCWGDNSSHQLGADEQGTFPVLAPVPVSRLRSAVQVAVGNAASCAVMRDGTVWCWGSNDYGRLSTAAVSSQWTPGRWPGRGYREVAITAGLTCARGSDGGVTCMGGPAHPFAPFSLALPGRATGLSAGRARMCALLHTGRVVCWDRQLRSPERVAAFPAQPVELAVATHHACARLVDGTVACWGDGNLGQVGVGAVGDVVQPTRVAGLDDVVGIAVAQGRSCATRSDGSVWCWGSNRVETGVSGAGETFHTPTRLAPLGPVQALRMGDTHTCALLRGGPLCCWGSDVRGQLGRGEYPRHALGRVPDATPVPVRW